MKTAVRICFVSCLALGASYTASAIAQGMASATVGAAVPAQQQQLFQDKSDAVATPKIVPSEPNVALPFLDLPKAPFGKSNEISSGKVPDSVKDVVKRLNNATEEVTLEDLNSARGAIAKLDVLIDIEKRLTDLASIRQEREEKTVATNTISASALMPRNVISPPSLPSQPFPQLPIVSSSSAPSAPIVPVSIPAADVEVERVQGARGHYAAMVKVGEGKSKQVREGDKISDGSIVKSINSEGITLLKDKKKRMIKVKDVGAVFGGR